MSDAATLVRPDPAKESIAVCFTYLFDKLEAIEQRQGEEKISAAEAAREFGYGPKYFHGRPWRYPDCWPSRRHSRSAWRAWEAIPEAVRRATWDALPLAERRVRQGLEK